MNQEYNIILVIIDKLIKWGYFIIYIYIKEVFIKYKILKKIISNRDLRFIIVF